MTTQCDEVADKHEHSSKIQTKTGAYALASLTPTLQHSSTWNLFARWKTSILVDISYFFIIILGAK